MLLRAARSPCWRAPRRLVDPRYALSRSSPRTAFYDGNQLRIFTTTGAWRKQDTGDAAAKQNPVDVATPKASQLSNAEKQKGGAAAKSTKNDLLSEKTVGDKEQRKADWAIIKEMAKYLWPKVRFRATAC